MMVNNECLQIGIVSFGESCAMGHRPTVYSSISAAYGWIEKQICALSNNPPSSCQASIISQEPFVGRSESNNAKAPSPSPSPSPWPSQSSVDSTMPSDGPSLAPSDKPSIVNSAMPSDLPSLLGSALPSAFPSLPSSSLGPSTRPPPTKLFKNNEVNPTINSDALNTFFDSVTLPEGGFSTTGEDYNETTNSRRLKESNFEKEEDDEDYPFDTKAETIKLSNEQQNRGLQEPSFNVTDMPVGFFSFPLNVSTRADPDGTHLFFWPFGSPNTKLGPCEGDCDSDEDCNEGLYCFTKDLSVTSVPGCVGFDMSRTDFCTYKNQASSNSSYTATFPLLFAYEENPPNISSLPLQNCQGDCDSNTDCADGLICYERPANETSIPGCSGISITRTDFCIDPDALITDSLIPSDGSSLTPTDKPSVSDSANPTFVSSPLLSSSEPFTNATFIPTGMPSPQSSSTPSRSVTSDPTSTPTEIPTSTPSSDPTFTPTEIPTSTPSRSATSDPTSTPTGMLTTEKATTQRLTLAPSQSPVSITVAIFFDPWPEEVSWKIESEAEEELITSVPLGSYISPQDQAFELVAVTPGENYIFTIEDAGRDGIAGIGTLYEIFLTDHPDIILVDGDGVFEDSHSDTFYVPTIDEYPTSAPTESTVSPAPTINTVNVYLIIIFDSWHQETSWIITDEDDSSLVYAEAEYDTYRAGESITEEIALPPGRTYTFTIEDFFDDGIENGEYLMMTADGTILFEGNGDFESHRSHTFTLPDGPSL